MFLRIKLIQLKYSFKILDYLTYKFIIQYKDNRKKLIMSVKKINGYIIYLKEVIGKGSYGLVYRGQHEQTKKPCAVKMLSKVTIDSDIYLKNALLSQIQILTNVKSENIVAMFDVMESVNNYYIIQELCDSDLEGYILKNKVVSEKTALDLLKQICNGFLALVKEGILHRDLKPANILMVDGVIKIGDFGFAKKNASKNMKNQSCVGTPLYMPVQILKSESYTSKCDIWAVGVIFYELLHGQTPWVANNIFDLVNNIEKKPLKINESLPQNFKTFLRQTLEVNELDRMNWDELFIHPIFENQFMKYAQDNKKFENKLKSLMGALRFKVHSQNIDVTQLFELLNYSKDKELNFQEFHEFLASICPDISKNQVKYVFEKVDTDASGSISIEEIQNELDKHKIERRKKKDEVQFYKRATTLLEPADLQALMEMKKITLSEELLEKVKSCFARLFKVISSKKLTLFKTFKAYDKSKSGCLTENEFKHMILRLDTSFSQTDVKAVFRYIDKDDSKTIQYEELAEVYCKCNGIPQSFQQK